MANKLENFRKVAPDLFRPLVDIYGYIFEEQKTNKIRDIDWSIHLIYINNDKNLKIIIKQEPYYTDYGFSFFIYKLGTEQYNILCHIEHHRQDEENLYLFKAFQDLFTSEETLDIISGAVWKELNEIPFRTV